MRNVEVRLIDRTERDLSYNDQVADATANFWNAIVASLPLKDVVMDKFPAGTCGDTAILLG